MTPDLDAIVELRKAATPGPWHYPVGGSIWADGGGSVFDGSCRTTDAAFIAAAGSFDFDALQSRLAALEGELRDCDEAYANNGEELEMYRVSYRDLYAAAQNVSDRRTLLDDGFWVSQKEMRALDNELSGESALTPDPDSEERTDLEHLSGGTCWCQPVVDYEDALTGDRVYVHRRAMDGPAYEEEK